MLCKFTAKCGIVLTRFWHFVTLKIVSNGVILQRNLSQLYVLVSLRVLRAHIFRIKTRCKVKDLIYLFIRYFCKVAVFVY